MTDASFLQAIFDMPDDTATRLIYADWLEEQGDPRGELLRVRCQLAALPPKDRKRKKLEARERELVSLSDERWLVLLERAEWRRLYNELEPSGKHKARWQADEQEAIGGALAAFEVEVGHKLPRSYKAFAHVFGPGELAGYFRFNVPTMRKKFDYDLASEHRQWHEARGESWIGSQAWLKESIVIGTTIGGEMIALDTRNITDAISGEYRVCWLDRSDRLHRAADSFPRFIDEVCFTVFDEEGEETPREFLPYRL